MEPRYETIVLGGGCFWCTEAIFQRLKGVNHVESGYANGKTDHPTYQQVSSGDSGYVEVSKITFDPGIISIEDLLYLFMISHDPCSQDQQGADIGSQYRSVILYTDEKQKQAAETVIQDLASVYKAPIITEIAPLRKYFTAEDHHQNYYDAHESAGYCRVVIEPKLARLRQLFADKFTDEKIGSQDKKGL